MPLHPRFKPIVKSLIPSEIFQRITAQRELPAGLLQVSLARSLERGPRFPKGPGARAVPETYHGFQGQAMIPTSGPERTREPAILGPMVADLFYPGRQDLLSKVLDDLLDGAPSIPLPGLRALICPHAGYRFSGPTAACAYKQLEGHDFRTVIVLGPSHYALFKGAALPEATSYCTPLGAMKLSGDLPRLGTRRPFVLAPPCSVNRPDWWRERPGGPPLGRDTPFTWEHSVEVQLPFLQRVLPKAELVPVVCGALDPREMAQALADCMDDRTLLVASSDLSHFHTYSDARRRDESCVRAICALDTDRMGREEACGKEPILALMHLAKQRGWRAQLLDLRSSGDAGACKASVVGYAAIAFCEPERAKAELPGALAPAERGTLLGLARRALEAAVSHRAPPQLDPEQLTPALQKPGACFVTLTSQGQLRGCIGHLVPREALARSVQDNARAAALEDPRFPPVTPEEVAQLEIEISVLTPPQPLAFKSPAELLRKLQPGRDGVLLKRGGHQATFLPQVWEQFSSKEEFLRQLSLKARGGADLWSQPGTEVLVYQVEAFKER